MSGSLLVIDRIEGGGGRRWPCRGMRFMLDLLLGRPLVHSRVDHCSALRADTSAVAGCPLASLVPRIPHATSTQPRSPHRSVPSPLLFPLPFPPFALLPPLSPPPGLAVFPSPSSAMSWGGHAPRVCYFYDSSLGSYYYGAGHPMKPHRLRMTHSLLLAYGMYKKMEVYRPHPASQAELERFHASDYVDFIRRVTPDNSKEFLHQLQKYNLGPFTDCPIFDGMYDYCSVYAGGSIDGALKFNHGQFSSLAHQPVGRPPPLHQKSPVIFVCTTGPLPHTRTLTAPLRAQFAINWFPWRFCTLILQEDASCCGVWQGSVTSTTSCWPSSSC